MFDSPGPRLRGGDAVGVAVLETKKILSELKKLRLKSDGDFYLPDLKPFIKTYAGQHELALELWTTGNKAARTLAYNIADPARVTEHLIDKWVEDLDEWDLVDGFTAILIRPTKFARTKPFEWAQREETYVRRAAFSLIAQMAWQKNDFEDALFKKFLPLVGEYAHDDRLHVKKAVNWALRDIGKRNDALKSHAQKIAARLQKSDDKTARWVGTHRMKEISL